MGLDKLVDSSQLDTDLTTIANAIRTKGGTSAQLAFPSGFADAIAAISSGGSSPVTFTATAVSTSTTIVFDAGDYTIPEKYALFLKSDVAAGDGINIIIYAGFFIKEANIPIINTAITSVGRYFTHKIDGGVTDYNPGGPDKNPITKNGSNLNLLFNTNHKFLSGGTYSIQIYELDDTFFTV